MKNKYVIISSVRNEENYIERTLNAIINQTILPERWIIVNDGSTDNTSNIIASYQSKIPWITKVDLADRGHYLPGEGIVKAFYEGFELAKDLKWDFIIKLDCDLSFTPLYIENLLQEFDNNPKLGIASGGIYNVKSDDKLVQEKGKEDHPWGAAIMFRKECFKQIGGLQATLGWELASILNAQLRGWDTKCFFHLMLLHYRLTGNRHLGFTKGRFRHGRNLYKFGYPFYYTLLKGIYRLFEEPYLIGSIGIISGHIYALIKREPFLYNKEMRKHLNKRLRRIILPGLNVLSK